MYHYRRFFKTAEGNFSFGQHIMWSKRNALFIIVQAFFNPAGRIIAIADVFDALTSQRPYKKPFTVEKSVKIIKEGKGQHFDPDLIDIFLENLEKVLRIKDQVNTNY